jgi:hypothetical protein
MLTSNHRGRGHDPVTVLGRIISFVTVNAMRLLGAAILPDVLPRQKRAPKK